ncbi:hypothetical protein CLIB1423_06S01750 [[Candida] railenensis]|uniref:Serine protease n=1 Tax=[Candida] railenensis TaxID=45579 RepID=A0A9P0QPQ8_9ASCO|nr:hypothetical protein CLIB1423_06S01750 [[Candida] railenensis]
MAWSYTPICIRFLPKYNDKLIAVSGIFLVLKDEKDDIIDKAFLSICNLTNAEMESKYNIFVSAGGLINETELKWVPVSFDFYSNIFNKNSSTSDKLYTSIKYFTSHGFKLIPFESRGSQDVDFLYGVKIAGFKMNSANFEYFSRSVKNSLQVISFRGSAINSNIIIESSPFSFTNPALFINFVSHGTINLVISQDDENDERELGYISDTKYLENMVGGVVKVDEVNSIGLVLGNVRKLNGDGDLTLILSWNTILRGLKGARTSGRLEPSPLASEIHFITNNLPENVADSEHRHGTSKGVLAITVESSSPHRSYWGSGVLFDKETIITNDHVVNVNLKQAKISIYLSKNTWIVLDALTLTDKINPESSSDQIITPFNNLDISFIKLSKQNQKVIASMGNLHPVQKGLPGDYKVGDTVTTVGFGLFLSKAISQQPLSSQGVISSIARFPIFEGTPSSDITPSLIVTSSSCWNGSSGGGLFDIKYNKLLGMICSNAEVNIPEILFDGPRSVLAKTEKVSKFSLCIPIEVINELSNYIQRCNKYDKINNRISNAWKLLPTHEEIEIDTSARL